MANSGQPFIPTATQTVSSSASFSSTSSSARSSSSTSISFPPCAESCLAAATSSLPCAETDSKCLCLHASLVQSSVNGCLTNSNACSTTDKTAAVLYYDTLCQSLGYSTDSEASSLPTAALVTATGTPSNVFITPSASSSSIVAIPSSSASSTSHHNGVSVPAIAGIAAGGAFLIAVIVTVIVFFYVRRRASSPVIILDSEKYNLGGASPTTRPTSSYTVRSRRSLFFTLEPSSLPPSASLTQRSNAATVEQDTKTGSQVEGKTMTLTNASYTWYNKKEAELSTTSLTLIPQNVLTPIPNSPAVTEFSDKASIHSVTSSSHGDEVDDPVTSPILSRSPSRGSPGDRNSQSKIALSKHHFSPPARSFTESRTSPSQPPSQPTAPRKAPPPGLSINSSRGLPYESYELDLTNSRLDRRISQNPLGQNPSPRTPTFRLDLPTPSSADGFDDVFKPVKH